MKKILSLIMAAAMILCLLAGCGSTPAPAVKEDPAPADKGDAAPPDADYSYHWKLATTETSD